MVRPLLSCWGSFGWDGQAHNSGEALAGGDGERDHGGCLHVCPANIAPVRVSGLGGME